MSSENICGTQLTIDSLSKALQKYFGTLGPKLEKVTRSQIAVGEGFTSKIYRLELTWSNDEKTPEAFPKTVILKAASIEILQSFMQKFCGGEQQNIEAMVQMTKELTNTEITVYNLLGPLGIVPMPICYASELFANDSSQGFLVMEDLSPKSSTVQIPSTEAPLSLEQVLNIVEIVANFHAWCISTDTPLSKYFGTLEDFKESYTVALKGYTDGVCSMKKKFPLEFGDVNEEAVASYFHFDNYLELHNRYIGILPSVLVHADFWLNNIMFKLNPTDGQVTNDVYAIIDWQTCHLGNCMDDFGRLFSFFPVEFLDSHIDNILRNYYEIIKSKCGETLTASFEDMKNLYEEQFAINGLQFFSTANVWLAMETENVDLTQCIVKLCRDNYKIAAKTLKL